MFAFPLYRHCPLPLEDDGMCPANVLQSDMHLSRIAFMILQKCPRTCANGACTIMVIGRMQPMRAGSCICFYVPSVADGVASGHDDNALDGRLCNSAK